MDELSKLKEERELLRETLIECDRILQSSRVWGGFEYVYHPMHPVKYKPLLERIRITLDIVDGN